MDAPGSTFSALASSASDEKAASPAPKSRQSQFCMPIKGSVPVPRDLFRRILGMIDDLRPRGCAADARGGDNASTEGTITPFRLPVGPESSYIGVNKWRMGRPSGKCRIKSYIEEYCTSCELASLFDVADSATRSEPRARPARGVDMADQLTSATWFWLLVPILACVGLSILTMIFRRKAER
jgi:hypothetical protein